MAAAGEAGAGDGGRKNVRKRWEGAEAAQPVKNTAPAAMAVHRAALKCAGTFMQTVNCHSNRRITGEVKGGAAAAPR